jgi:LmbE family N-acetylglucosaminyl deacetylase
VGHTVVSFHAHPDDEALLTAGTLARAVAEGHRVVLVTATAGDVGLAATRYGHGDTLATHRLDELRRSAQALGAARVEVLGYADSGLDGTAPAAPAADGSARTTLVRADPDEAAERLAGILREESAQVLTIYDANGGYGHPDHIAVHHIGLRAARIAGTPIVLEATVDRDLLVRALRLVSRFYRLPPEFDLGTFRRAYTPRSAITHRVDVRRYADRKRASMQAHASQTTADSGDRTLAALLRLPRPLYRRVLGREWFVEHGRPPGGPLLDDIFASLR